MKISKYDDIKNNALMKRNLVMSAMKKVDKNFKLGYRVYDAKRIDGKENQLKRIAEKENALHY